MPLRARRRAAGRTGSSCRRGRTGPRSAGCGRSATSAGSSDLAGLVALAAGGRRWRTSCRCSPRPAAGGWRRTACPSGLHPSAVDRTARGDRSTRAIGRSTRRRGSMPAVIVVAGEALVDLVVTGDGDRRPRPAARRTTWPGAAPGSARRRRCWRRCRPTASASGSPPGWPSRGVDDGLLQRTDRPTTLAVAQLDADGAATYRFYTEGTSAPSLTPGRAARPSRRRS